MDDIDKGGLLYFFGVNFQATLFHQEDARAPSATPKV
jgi:hypothetical protein